MLISQFGEDPFLTRNPLSSELLVDDPSGGDEDKLLCHMGSKFLNLLGLLLSTVLAPLKGADTIQEFCSEPQNYYKKMS